MSHTCNLCGGWDDRRPKTVTITPDFPAGVGPDETAKLCYSCYRAIDKSPDTECAWCGSPGGVDLYHRGRMITENVGTLCWGCFSKAQGEYPAAFSESLKTEVREDSNNKCAECGMPQSAHQDELGQKLHVHHKDGDKQNNSKKNLVALCARCHGRK